MQSLYDKSQQKLELDQVLTLLSQCADSADGKLSALQIRPTSDLEDVLALLDETTAAASMCTRKGNPYFGDISDVSFSLERAQKGGCLQTTELLSIGGVLRRTRTVKSYISEDDDPTVLDAFFSALCPNKY